METSAWSKLEKINRGKFPNCVKKLLTECAYNELYSLRRIDAEKLRNIESFLNGKKEIISQLDCCYKDHYKNLDVFEFLPGHKDLILSIPSLIEEMGHGGKSRISAIRNNMTFSDDQLKSKLIANLLSYTENIGLDVPDNAISEINIHDFRRGSDQDGFVCKCRLICPFCLKKFQLTYKTFWATSNLTKHFKDHITEIEVTVE